VRTRARGVALAGLIVALAGCSNDDNPTEPTPYSGPPLLLAFASDRAPSQLFYNDIWFADLSTGEAPFAPLNVNSSSDEGPMGLSGDGRTLAFSSSRILLGSLSGFCLMDVATGQLTLPFRTRQFNGPQNPSLSYDGRYLATNYQIGGDPFMQVVAVEDLAADTLLTLASLNDLGFTNFDPSLNGDATLIAYATNGTHTIGAFDIVLYSVPRDSFIDLPGLNSNQQDLGPAISADGRYIAFTSGRAGGAGLIDVYVYDRQTSSLLDLPGLNTEFSEVQPCLSPDGRYLACTTESEGAGNVRLYDIIAKHVVAMPGVNHPRNVDQYPVLSSRPPSIAR
jgi:Tol biopolymer transport system component